MASVKKDKTLKYSATHRFSTKVEPQPSPMDEDEEASGSEVSANESFESAEESCASNSDPECEEEDKDISDDEMDRASIEENMDGDDWMAVDANDSDSEMSSLSEEERCDTKGPLTTLKDDPKLHGNSGWADAMAKILRTSKPKGKKSIVLAKAKKLSQVSVSQKKPETDEGFGFEIDGKAVEEDIKPKVEELDIKPEPVDIKPKIRRRDQLAEGKVRPSILGRERERALSKTATKGVVQLFNAVREQQKEIKIKLKQANGSIRKEDKILKSIDKRAFLDVLMGNAKSERVDDLSEGKEEDALKTEKPATWDVLRDNYLTGSNLKDWDKCGEIKVEDVDEVELE